MIYTEAKCKHRILIRRLRIFLAVFSPLRDCWTLERQVLWILTGVMWTCRTYTSCLSACIGTCRSYCVSTISRLLFLFQQLPSFQHLVHYQFRYCWPTSHITATSSIHHPTAPGHTASPAQLLWPTGFLCGWSVGLEFPAGQLAESDYWRNSFRQSLNPFLFATYWCIQRIRGFMRMRYINRLFTYLEGHICDQCHWSSSVVCRLVMPRKLVSMERY